MRSDRCRSREGGLQAGKNRISRHAACLVWSAGGDAHRPLIGLAKYVNYLTLGDLGDGYPLNHPKKAIFGALSRLNVLHELPPCQCGGQGPCEPWGVKSVVCPGKRPTTPTYDLPPQSIRAYLREFVGEQGVLPRLQQPPTCARPAIFAVSGSSLEERRVLRWPAAAPHWVVGGSCMVDSSLSSAALRRRRHHTRAAGSYTLHKSLCACNALLQQGGRTAQVLSLATFGQATDLGRCLTVGCRLH